MYHAMNTLGDVKAMAFWCFTDVFEESLVPSSPFYGGFGLMNRDGLRSRVITPLSFFRSWVKRSPLRVMVMWPLRIKMGACSFCCIIMSIWIICFQAGTGRRCPILTVTACSKRRAARYFKSTFLIFQEPTSAQLIRWTGNMAPFLTSGFAWGTRNLDGGGTCVSSRKKRPGHPDRDLRESGLV